MNNVVKKKSIVFLLSDFLDEDFSNAISLVSKKHDLSGIRVFDSFEKNILSMGLGLFVNPETNSYHWLDTSDKKVRKHIEMEHAKKANYFRDSFLKNGASVVNVSTQDSYIIKLLELFKNK